MSDYSTLPVPTIFREKEILDEAYRILDTALESNILVSEDREIIIGLLSGENLPYGIRDTSSSSKSQCLFEVLSETATTCFFCSHEIEHLKYIGSGNRAVSKNFAESALRDITGRNMEMLFPVFMLPNIDSIDVQESASDGENTSIIGTLSLSLSHPTSLAKALIGDTKYSWYNRILASFFNKKKRRLVSIPVRLAYNNILRRSGSAYFKYKMNTEYSHLTVQIRQNDIPKESLYQSIIKAQKALIREVMALSVGSAVFHIAGLQTIKSFPALESHGYSGGSSNFSLDLSDEYESKHTRAAAAILTLEYRNHIESQVKAMNNMELFSDIYIADFISRKQALFDFGHLPNDSNVLRVPDVFWENTPKRKLCKHLKNILSVSNLASDVKTYRRDIVVMVIKEERSNRTLTKPI